MKHDFNQRRENRIANAKNRALKNKQQADNLYDSATEMASHIPMGQPILIGHHSEKRDRKYREKMYNKVCKSVEMTKKAEYYAEKAKAIEGNDAIFSDDPQAVQKLSDKLNAIKTMQVFMKSANRCVRKNDQEAFLKLEFGTVGLWEQLNIADTLHGKGFPQYKLTNNNANIRRIEQRIAKLKGQQERPPVDKLINRVRIFENREAGRLQVIFEGKPEEVIRKQLKGCGFRWSPTENAWQRHISNAAFHSAKQIAEGLE